MRFDVYRSMGIVSWKDERGRDVHGFNTAEFVKSVEAASAQEAIARARSAADPAPMVCLAKH